MGYYSVTANVIIHSNYSPDTTREVSVSRNAYVANQGDPAYVYVYLPDSPVFSRTGYDFVGYGYNSSMSSLSYHPGDSLTFVFYRSQTQNIHIYSLWQLKTYTVSYNANGGTGAPAAQTKVHGEALTLSSVVPTRSQYVFDGWSTTQGGQVEYQPGDSYTTDAAVTLYAVWHLAGATLDSVTDPVEIGSTGTATWTNFSPTATYKLELTCGTAPTVTVTKGAGVTSATFTIPNTWLAAISGSTSGTATATLTTYEGDTPLGSSTMGFVVNVPSGVKPTIDSFTAAVYSTNATVMSWGEFVQGFAKADLAVSATPGTGATISAITFSGPGISQTGTGTTARSDILNTPGTATFTVTVIDSRGRSETDSVTVTVYPYAAPVVISIGTMRADADGTTNNSSGDYLKLTPIYSLSSVNGNNSFTAQTLTYYEHGSSTPLATVSCVSGTTYGPPSNMWAINLADAYDIVVELTDALGSFIGGAVTLPSAGGIWYGRGNDRLGLGKAPAGPGLWIDWAMYLNERAGSTIHYGVVDGTSTATAFTATIPGISEYYDGLTIMLKNGVVTSASGFTININGLGAKQSYSNLAAATADTTLFNVNYTMLFIYDSTRVAGGGWICYRGYDSNTNTIGYQLRTNGYTLPASDKFYRYRLLFTSADNTKWIPANTSTSTNATASRTTNTRPINPFGPIVYYGSTTVINANEKPGVTALWQQYTFSLGYSFNNTGAALTMTLSLPVYLRCTPQADGSAVMDYFTQTLPSTEDGKIYILLGYAYSETNIELIMNHPVYYYKSGAIRIWTGA